MIFDFRQIANGFTTLSQSKFTSDTGLQYKNMDYLFCLFLSCLFFLEYEIRDVGVTIVCMFIEYLALNYLKTSSIKNYVAGIATHFKWLSLDVKVFTHYKVSLMLKAIEKSVRSVPKFKAIFLC